MTPEPPEPRKPEPRVVRAGNRGAFTLDGTRTFLVGRRQVAVIDPGPDLDSHVRALSSALSGASEIRILLTHHHGDHAGAARALAETLSALVYGPPSTGSLPLTAGQRISTDEGDLAVVDTPGHTRDHLAFHWFDAEALFAGDLLLGRGSTTWLGEYPGCVADYLASLDRVERLAPRVVYPSHGNPVRRVPAVIGAYRKHRLDRLHQLARALEEHPGASPETLMEVVYGRTLPERLSKAAGASIRVMLHHLGRAEEVERG